MRRSPPGLAFARRHEVAGGGHVVHREGQGATAPAVLGSAEEPFFFVDGHLACDLPGLAGGDAFVVNSLWAGPCVAAVWAAVAMAPLAFILAVGRGFPVVNWGSMTNHLTGGPPVPLKYTDRVIDALCIYQSPHAQQYTHQS